MQKFRIDFVSVESPLPQAFNFTVAALIYLATWGIALIAFKLAFDYGVAPLFHLQPASLQSIFLGVLVIRLWIFITYEMQ